MLARCLVIRHNQGELTHCEKGMVKTMTGYRPLDTPMARGIDGGIGILLLGWIGLNLVAPLPPVIWGVWCGAIAALLMLKRRGATFNGIPRRRRWSGQLRRNTGPAMFCASPHRLAGWCSAYLGDCVF